MDSLGGTAALDVNVDGLRVQVARLEAAAGEFTGNSPAAGVVPSWSASAAAVSAAHAQIAAASIRCTSRVQATATKLAAAATGYAENEDSSAGQFRTLYEPTVC